MSLGKQQLSKKEVELRLLETQLQQWLLQEEQRELQEKGADDVDV